MGALGSQEEARRGLGKDLGLPQQKRIQNGKPDIQLGLARALGGYDQPDLVGHSLCLVVTTSGLEPACSASASASPLLPGLF